MGAPKSAADDNEDWKSVQHGDQELIESSVAFSIAIFSSPFKKHSDTGGESLRCAFQKQRGRFKASEQKSRATRSGRRFRGVAPVASNL